jgi:hypothetical protein
MNGGVIAWRGVMTRYVKARDQPSSRLLLPDHVNWVIFMD